MKTLKVSKTIKEYKTNFRGCEITIPVGATVSNKTAMGNDDNYRFWIPKNNEIEKITYIGLKHDIEHYGINIPKEYCKPYEEI